MAVGEVADRTAGENGGEKNSIIGIEDAASLS